MNKIKKDGVFPIGLLRDGIHSNSSSVIYLAGAGTVSLKFRDPDGNLHPVLNGDLVNPGTTIVNHGKGAELLLDCAGGTEATPTFIKILPV